MNRARAFDRQLENPACLRYGLQAQPASRPPPFRVPCRAAGPGRGARFHRAARHRAGERPYTAASCAPGYQRTPILRTFGRVVIWRGEALLVIDLQNDYLPGGAFPLWNAEATLEVVERSIARAREKGVPVVIVQHVADRSQGLTGPVMPCRFETFSSGWRRGAGPGDTDEHHDSRPAPDHRELRDRGPPLRKARRRRLQRRLVRPCRAAVASPESSEHPVRHDVALHLSELRDAAEKGDVLLGPRDELVGGREVVGEGEVIVERLVGAGAEGAPAHVPRRVPHEDREQRPRPLFVRDEGPRLRQAEERVEGLLHRVERIVGRQPLPPRHAREARRVAPRKLRDPSRERSFRIFLRHRNLLGRPMYIQSLTRYPVKSMAGEPLREASLTPLGIEGDRVVQVVDALGAIVTSRNRPRLLGLHAALGPDGEPLVDGRRWTDDAVAAAVASAAGRGTRLRRGDEDERFDILPLLVTTDGALDALGRDVRRLRPNIVIGGVEGLAERSWEGAFLRVGEAVIGLHSLRGRCIMTTYDPDTLERDPEVLRDIGRRFGGRFGLNAWGKDPVRSPSATRWS
ncbi:MAG: isochorismatase family protein [Holophagales bacterium]|nr:isochorismatase family protein [Holophagales bacterium]